MKNEGREQEGFGVWAILELMGHVKMAGYVSEEELFGCKVGRIDVPADGGEEEAITQYFGGQSIYRLTPVSESVARAFARKQRPRPVHTWELALPDPEPSIRYDVDEAGGPFDPLYHDDGPGSFDEDYDPADYLGDDF